jgi:hypothetical protein
MSQVRPWQALDQIAQAVPDACRQHIVIIGSLAADYAFFGEDERMAELFKEQSG